jgi:uncharacterized protein YjiS (DUF1127 family)
MNGATREGMLDGATVLEGVNFAPARTAARRRVRWAAPWALLLRALRTVSLWRERSRHRLALDALDARTLRDIGLSRADVRREARKWFWRP